MASERLFKLLFLMKKKILSHEIQLPNFTNQKT